MKQFFLVMALLISSSFAAAKTPATDLVKKYLTPGTYNGKYSSLPCQTTVQISENAVSLAVQIGKHFDYFSVVDSGAYATDENTGELVASYPAYPGQYGMTKSLYFKATPSEVTVSIVLNSLDHHGQDNSVVTECVFNPANKAL